MALWSLWSKTKGTLSLDLKRRQWKGGVAGRDSLWRVYPPAATAAEPGVAGRRRCVGCIWGWQTAAGRPAPAGGSYYVATGVPPGCLLFRRGAACCMQQSRLAHCALPWHTLARRRPPPAHARPAYYSQPPPAVGGGYGAPAPPPPAQRGGYSGGYRGAPDLYEPPSLGFMDTGARIKVMRHVQVRLGALREGACGGAAHRRR